LCWVCVLKQNSHDVLSVFTLGKHLNKNPQLSNNSAGTNVQFHSGKGVKFRKVKIFFYICVYAIKLLMSQRCSPFIFLSPFQHIFYCIDVAIYKELIRKGNFFYFFLPPTMDFSFFPQSMQIWKFPSFLFLLSVSSILKSLIDCLTLQFHVILWQPVFFVLFKSRSTGKLVTDRSWIEKWKIENVRNLEKRYFSAAASAAQKISSKVSIWIFSFFFFLSFTLTSGV